ncbi:hypothetical protein [Alteribacter aurantiacus]|uniref:hypothetical protein n=1 Tax=Alteribacter aurantiacus TaxID=254410 RepID=UPI00047CAB85|nr:hypothetical protein [Alteribacter aurantiacus]
MGAFVTALLIYFKTLPAHYSPVIYVLLTFAFAFYAFRKQCFLNMKQEKWFMRMVIATIRISTDDSSPPHHYLQTHKKHRPKGGAHR